MVILDGATRVGRDAFENALNFTEVTIPDTVTSIEGGMFGNCSKLTGVVIPESVTYHSATCLYSMGLYYNN